MRPGSTPNSSRAGAPDPGHPSTTMAKPSSSPSTEDRRELYGHRRDRGRGRKTLETYSTIDKDSKAKIVDGELVFGAATKARYKVTLTCN